MKLMTPLPLLLNESSCIPIFFPHQSLAEHNGHSSAFSLAPLAFVVEDPYGQQNVSSFTTAVFFLSGCSDRLDKTLLLLSTSRIGLRCLYFEPNICKKSTMVGYLLQIKIFIRLR
ncbi:hypothetical protein ACOME3_003373 [Neoechinorhynchus agilis]